MYRPLDDDRVQSIQTGEQPASVAPLIPIMAVVLIAFLVIGIALPVLPLHVHQRLGFGVLSSLASSPAASSARRSHPASGSAASPTDADPNARSFSAC